MTSSDGTPPPVTARRIAGLAIPALGVLAAEPLYLLFDIAVVGRSGHAAHPEDAVDPIVAACHLVTQLQTVVSREVNPLHPCVVTVGAIHAGTVHNIIPDACVIRGTVRTLHAPVSGKLEGRPAEFIST